MCNALQATTAAKGASTRYEISLNIFENLSFQFSIFL